MYLQSKRKNVSASGDQKKKKKEALHFVLRNEKERRRRRNHMYKPTGDVDGEIFKRKAQDKPQSAARHKFDFGPRYISRLRFVFCGCDYNRMWLLLLAARTGIRVLVGKRRNLRL